MGLISGQRRSPVGGHGNSFQYSYLENPMHRGAWWATVHSVAKRQTQLSNLASNHLIIKTRHDRQRKRVDTEERKTSYLSTINSIVLLPCEQGGLHFHFALTSAMDVAKPVSQLIKKNLKGRVGLPHCRQILYHQPPGRFLYEQNARFLIEEIEMQQATKTYCIAQGTVVNIL